MAHAVALTGGTGFIGSVALPQLLEAGHSVRLLARDPAKVNIDSPQLTVIPGDLQNRTALHALASGVDTIIHCAGRVRGRSHSEFSRDNVAATQSLLDTSSTDVHFIYISSLAACKPALSHYAASKKQAEDVVRSHQTANWTIIRPPAVYGAEDRELRPLFDWMRRGLLWVPGDPSNRFSLLHVADLAQLINHVVELPKASLHIHEPHDGKDQGYQWRELQTIAAAVFNKRIRCYTIPKTILNSAAYANMIFSTLTNRSPMMTPGKVRELIQSHWVSDPEKSVAGWQPQIDLKVGLQKLYTQNH